MATHTLTTVIFYYISLFLVQGLTEAGSTCNYYVSEYNIADTTYCMYGCCSSTSPEPCCYDQQYNLSSGTIAGIIAGSIGGAIVFLITIICFCNLIRHKRNNDKNVTSSDYTNNKQDDGSYINRGFSSEPTAPEIPTYPSAPPPSYNDVISNYSNAPQIQHISPSTTSKTHNIYANLQTMTDTNSKPPCNTLYM